MWLTSADKYVTGTIIEIKVHKAKPISIRISTLVPVRVNGPKSALQH